MQNNLNKQQNMQQKTIEEIADECRGPLARELEDYARRVEAWLDAPRRTYHGDTKESIFYSVTHTETLWLPRIKAIADKYAQTPGIDIPQNQQDRPVEELIMGNIRMTIINAHKAKSAQATTIIKQ